ncbi:MAG: class I SAM-dependent methyltransferase [Bryobacteraceae bacterium]
MTIDEPRTVWNCARAVFRPCYRRGSKDYLSGPALSTYVRTWGVTEVDAVRRLREETALHPQGNMQIAPEQGQFLQVLLRAMGARNTLEVGVFTGYSTTVTALALPPEGRVIACDVNDEFTSIARRYWKEAGVEHKIELRLGPAAETLRELLAQHRADTFDFAFIDADKTNYDLYFELALKLTRKGGLIAIDNTLWHGRVLQPHSRDADVLAIQALNRKLHNDSRVLPVLLPIADGMTLALKL